MELHDIMRLMMGPGHYMEKCPDQLAQLSFFEGESPPEPAERFVVFDHTGRPVQGVNGRTLSRHGLWKVIKKDNDLAWRKQINRYFISRRKILSLRKNNPIKRTYKELRQTNHDVYGSSSKKPKNKD